MLIICIIELVIILALAGYVIFTMVRSRQSTKTDPMVEVEQMKLYSVFDFDKIDDRIDKYIDEIGSIYKMNNFEYKDPEEVYLTEDIMNEMIRYMIKEVRKRITPPIMSLIKMSYNINSEDDLIQLLYDRIRMYVLQYSFEVNADIE